MHTRELIAALAATEAATAGPFDYWSPADVPLRRLVVTWAVTADQLASASGTSEASESSDQAGTVYVCRAHPFFASPGPAPDEVHQLDSWAFRSYGDAVVRRKRELLRSSGATVVWAPALWNRTDADEALAQAALPATAGGIGTLPTQANTADEAFAPIAANLGAPYALVTGTAPANVRTIAFVSGTATPARLSELAADERIDAVVTGDLVEWEGVPWTHDANTLGRPLVAATVGMLASEQPMNDRIAADLARLAPATEVGAHLEKTATWIPGKAL